MHEFDQEKYQKAKNTAVNFFVKNKILDPACLGNIQVNSDGFMHLIRRTQDNRHKRDWRNQIKRFYLLQYLKPVLKGMKYYQEYLETLEKVKVKRGGQTKHETRIVRYWAFIAVINNRIRIKIVLRKIGEGNIHFWSVIPIWKTREYKNIKYVSLHKGNPKKD